jgi:hypothetical protein
MRTIEAKLHDILIDLLPDQYNSYNQAKIIAEATDIFNKSINKKTASNKNGETGLVKALWAALSTLGLDEDFEDTDSNYVDGFGLDPNQIVRSAVNQNAKQNFKFRKMSMEILNDSELDVILNNEIDNVYNFDDATDEELHPIGVYKSPGDAKHHTDSRVTPG